MEEPAPGVGEVEVLEAQAVHERGREVERADVLDGVVAEVEVREAGVLRDEDGEGDGAGGLALVATEVEGRECGAQLQGLGEDLDAAVVQAVEAEVEVAQRMELGEPGLQQDNAVDAHVAAIIALERSSGLAAVAARAVAV